MRLRKTLFGPTERTILTLLTVIAVGSTEGSVIVHDEYSGEWVSDWLQNFSTEMMGAMLPSF